MFFIGCDPDLHATGLAVINDGGSPIAASVIKCKGDTGWDAVAAMVDCLLEGEGEVQALLKSAIARNIAAVAVEAQEIAYSAKQGANPRSVMYLSPVTGMFSYSIKANCPNAKLYLPPPQGWKGSVPKKIHQARIARRLGWAYGVAGGGSPYIYPTSDLEGVRGADKLNKGDWKHVMDAFGLALYARDRWLKEEDRENEDS